MPGFIVPDDGPDPSFPVNPGYVLYTCLGPNAHVPTRAHQGDAGFDLYASREVIIQPGSFQDVPTDIAIAMPPGIYGRITGRSSTWRKLNLLVLEGIIDNGYTGELFVGVHHPTWGGPFAGMPARIQQGDRIAQIIFAPLYIPTFRDGLLPETDRGAKGFGSTGR